MGVPFFCPYENMKDTKVLHGFYLLNIWQYGHLQVSPPSPAISQAVGQTKPLLSHSEHLTKIENMSDNTDQTVVLCVYFRVCWLHHVPFQSWFHDNLCSSSKGMEKPVFERNYSMYIYIYITLSKLGSIAGSACQRANMGKSSALWALTEQILKIRL